MRRRHRAWSVTFAGMTAIIVGPALTGCAPDPPSAVAGVRATGCRNVTGTGSGMFVRVAGGREPLLLTSAHVVKGATEITITRDGDTGHATIVAFDPDMDIAYLSVDGLSVGSPRTVDSDSVTAGADGYAYVARDGGVAAVPVTIRRRVTIRTEDIYVEGSTRRPGFELHADIDPGDSGGAVVVEGRVVGIVWARSSREPGRAYAIDVERAGALVREQLRTGRIDDRIDLSRC